MVRADAPVTRYVPTAELVVEVLSPGDESLQKLPHHAAHDVGEVWLVDPDEHVVRVLQLGPDGYQDAQRSALFDLPDADMERALSWPTADD